jgi:phosphoglycerate kinase
MNKKTIRDINVQNKKVVVRVDFNVPLKKATDGSNTLLVDDDTRIQAALPTIRELLSKGAAVILMSHLGRPDGEIRAEFSLLPVAKRLSELLSLDVTFFPNCVGSDVSAACKNLTPGAVVLLENLRFHAEEEGKLHKADALSSEEKEQAKTALKAKQKDFAKSLAELGDCYVNDAFGAAHRAHASTSLIAQYAKESVAGLLMEKELRYLGRAVNSPERPFGAILGGAKVSDKVEVINNLLSKVDFLIIGGAMAYTFLTALDVPTGNSLVEKDKVDLAKSLLASAAEKGVELLLPVDHIIADKFSAEAMTEVVHQDGIKDGWMALDIGPETQQVFCERIANARTILWNGPLGAFEMEPFSGGTFAIAKAIASTHCVSIVGGGDSVSAINKAGLQDQMTHISTGGGASLEFLEGKVLPGVACLNEKEA